MSKARSSSRTRRSEVELQRRLAARRERRRLSIAAIAIAITVIAIIGSAIWIVGARSAVESDPAIAGLRSFDGLKQTHVEGAVDYPMLPPVGGPHAADFANCGIYTRPVANENAVHSLEHGAVWITYEPSMASGQLKVLQTLARSQPYVLLSVSDL